VPELLPTTDQIFAFSRWLHTRSGWTPKLRTTKFGLKKLETPYWHTVLTYLQIIISFCHNARIWQTDRVTDRQATATARSNRAGSALKTLQH